MSLELAPAAPPHLGYEQKYCLQRRNRYGYFERVATFDREVKPDEVLRKYNAGYYVLRATKPRFRTIWKQKLGETDQSKELADLKKRTTHLTYGLVGLTATELVGLGLTHWRFSKLEDRMDRAETILQSFKTTNSCGTCGKPLDFYLQKFCSQCGSPTIWPTKYAAISSPVDECNRCGFPMLGHQIYCPSCGTLRLVQASYTLKPEANLGFVMVNGPR